ARREDSAVAVAIDEGVRRVAVGADGGDLVGALVVLQGRRQGDGKGPAAHGRVEGGRYVIDLQGDVHDAVAVLHQPEVLGVVRCQRRGQDEGDLALAEDVAGLAAHAR